MMDIFVVTGRKHNMEITIDNNENVQEKLIIAD